MAIINNSSLIENDLKVSDEEISVNQNKKIKINSLTVSPFFISLISLVSLPAIFFSDFNNKDLIFFFCFIICFSSLLFYHSRNLTIRENLSFYSKSIINKDISVIVNNTSNPQINDVFDEISKLFYLNIDTINFSPFMEIQLKDAVEQMENAVNKIIEQVYIVAERASSQFNDVQSLVTNFHASLELSKHIIESTEKTVNLVILTKTDLVDNENTLKNLSINLKDAAAVNRNFEQVVAGLIDRTRQINVIVRSVNDIASQTNYQSKIEISSESLTNIMDNSIEFLVDSISDLYNSAKNYYNDAQSIGHAIDNVNNNAEETMNLIYKLIEHLQFQDITRQELDKIIKTINEINDLKSEIIEKYKLPERKIKINWEERTQKNALGRSELTLKDY